MDLKLAAEDLLSQLEEVVDQLTDENFIQPLEILSNSSIGQHVRHTLEFFICLVDARNTSHVNYDNRKHDKLIETDRSLAKSVIRSMKEFMAQLDENQSLTLEMSYGTTDDELITVSTNILREVAYNIEHTVHHMALIKIGVVNNFCDVTLPDHFGVASSTVRYNANK